MDSKCIFTVEGRPELVAVNCKFVAIKIRANAFTHWAAGGS